MALHSAGLSADPQPVGAVFAPAKINLALHVVGRRADGYHCLDSLVVFASVGDEITAFPGDAGPALMVDGPFAAGLSAGDDNLIARADRAFRQRCPALPPLALRLSKHLPVSSGIGGGSADGGATLRLLAFLAGTTCNTDLEALALTLGADGPMCLRSTPLRARGIGEMLEPWDRAPKLDLVLVNPGVAVSTPAVFRRLDRPGNPPLSDTLPSFDDSATLAAFLTTRTRNDLAAPAAAEAPEISAAERALAAADGCLLARMSGSGATVFGLFADAEAAGRAASSIAAARPDWWVRAATTITGAEAAPRGHDEIVGG
ncbi:4-(cytidine 5'-diphospho)-2-C-methyl-D-erythritol kinase [Mesorhizobium sp. BR1-1-16]|uniref:4-(cytidine 5'-diphospho)-2-C-methyl-D-erythritol kinase n=1 Tax=Mesorhizobium sp. BR1-1-16 TaxID=2876653 RepID=UPI001CCD9C32|nr:4-(cytidine 5'-diphospho)-2-C-methyl-D-erythritol kinase [Mesorhizobium sp. BR1-1-16]MBZ9934839.1 4-(cytidine 5'-diphospho)-2-C-methyl-D-erythritol kinase [Mesorhizobium sp. BR1-1-16]